jgi:hypothetical protein
MRFLRLAATLWWALSVFALPAAADNFRLLVLDNAFVKWGDPVLGTGAVVTYGFATTETTNQDARNCKHMTAFADLAFSSKLPLDALKQEARQAFGAWEDVSGLRFREADQAEFADILIGIQADPQGLAFTNVAPFKSSAAASLLASLKNSLGLGMSNASRVDTIRQSLICLNPLQTWKIGLDGNNKTYDVGYALTHEIGHAIGLDHPGPSGALMSFRYNEKIQGLQSGDIAAARTLYGPADRNSSSP